MPTISQAGHVFTEIVVFTVEPEHQQPLIDAIVSEVDRWVKHQPGFISASFHKSLDGTKVVNYAQWQSQADWRAFTQDPQGKVLSEKIKQVGIKTSEGHSYEVQRVVDSNIESL